MTTPVKNPQHYCFFNESSQPNDKGKNYVLLYKKPGTKGNLIKRKKEHKIFLEAKEILKNCNANPNNSKHQKKIVRKEFRRIHRMLKHQKADNIYIKIYPRKSLKDEINQKLFLDSSCNESVDANTNTFEITSLTPSCALSDDDLEYVVNHFPNLRSLNLNNCMDVTDRGLRHLERLPLLENLYLKCNNFFEKNYITEEGLSHLSSLRLKYLALIGFSFQLDLILSLYKGLPLEYLYLDNCNFTDKGLQAIQQFSSLKKLLIHACNGVTDEGIWFLRILPLELLVIRDCLLVSNFINRYCKSKEEVLELFSDLAKIRGCVEMFF